MMLEWREAVERMDVYLRELLSSGLLLLHAELGVDVGLKAELLPPGLLACVAAGLGLLLVLLLLFSVCRCFSKKTAERVAPEVGKISKPKSEEVKKRSRKRGDKKVQRNGQAVDLEEELMQNQNLSQSLDPADGKSEKGKKNKKKTKTQVKETKSTSERREPEEAGAWETKVSQREKRQQRRKDKGTGDESGSPGGTELSTNAANTQHAAAVEEPKIISAPSVTSKTTNLATSTKSSNNSTSSSSSTTSNTTTKSATTSTKSSNPTASNTTTSTKSSNPTASNTTTSTKSSNPTASNTTTSTKSSNPTASNITTSTKSSNPTASNTTTSTKSSNPTASNTTTSTKSSNPTKNTKSSNPTASNTTTSTKSSNPTKNTKSSNPTASTTTKSSPTPAPKAQKNSPRTQQVVAPVEHDPPVAEATCAAIPPVSHAWDVIGVNGSGSWDLGVSVPPHSQTWNSVNPEPSVWPQDMEGSWMMVDGSHIPVSLHGMTGGVPESSWACPAAVDDEWSGPNSSSADPASDYCAPCEEWGNYEEPAGGAVPPVETQDSDPDPEKDRDELAAPGSSKAKRKKKKKKKAEEAGGDAQVEVEVGVAKDQKAAGNTKGQEVRAPPPVLLKPTEPEAPPKSTAPPIQNKPEESPEPQKQVKKKKARRET